MKSSTIKDAEKRFKRLTTIICDTLEIVIAAIVIIGILIAISSLFRDWYNWPRIKGLRISSISWNRSLRWSSALSF